MADVYKLLTDIICKSIDYEWEKAVVEIESSPKRMFSTNACCYLKNGAKKAFELLDENSDEDLGEKVFELQESMYPNHKWNKAVYTLEKSGHFDMTFEWNQALQDEWDNA
ncbi:MAG: hypothetical protein II921_02380 [Treponema sp.]|nr:hypothetical protein [Treponema sp.]